ncbi:MAG: cysteine--tRNA ligase [Parcubacteria group bacterium 21-54-25]|nr:MAG: cysteine--tRNA ligase [Parcubacteria group bacterium 21-54-25]HQU07784.1 cysteine--tRNA ligase [Candidatus Paceibacterota bacterium]
MSWLQFPIGTQKKERGAAAIFLTNTLTEQKEQFVPLKSGIATLYSCGPTVYDRAHIGNLRPHVFADTLARTITHAGYRVRRVINITDVGHLVSDGDEGEDKVEIGARREGLSAKTITERYTKFFLDDLEELNIDTKHILFPRASEYVKEQISLARTLEEKGFAYRVGDGLYFDTSRFPGYGKLGGVSEAVLSAGARVEVNPEKHRPTDFALWKITAPGVRRLQEWDSPWGRGAPGWHLECSAMARALLGVEVDIHTGGMDLISVHHNNEIAQSEAASGRPFARYWLHNAFLTMDGNKVSKSLGNVVYLSDIVEHGFHPLVLRYFFHQAHYRTPISFTWEALAASAEALSRLWRLSRTVRIESGARPTVTENRIRFVAALRDDLNTAQALGILWEVLRDEDVDAKEKWGLLLDADALLGLLLTTPPDFDAPLSDAMLPEDVRIMRNERDAARVAKDFAAADTMRERLIACGYRVEDGPDGTLLFRDA